MSEPVLRGEEIQGDSLAGFRKDHVSLLFLEFHPKHIATVKQWLRDLEPRLARLNAVARFNASFRRVKRELHVDPDVLGVPYRFERRLTALWINIAFTSQGLTKLVGEAQVRDFETAFRLGAHVRAVDIGDPTDGSPGTPSQWLIGGPGNVPDAMLNIAADVEADRIAEVDRIRAEIAAIAPAIRVMYEDVGNARLAPHHGHEHFGFKDGVSQPGVRGTLDGSGDVLTPRLIDPSDPLGATFAAPGVPLIEPGEFVLGYDRQDPNSATASQAEADTRVEPAWARDGSYVVYRRLRQNVPAFERFLDHGVAQLTAQGFTVDRERFGAMCVGRWKDGTPMARSPLYPDPDIARDRDASQSFFFWRDTEPVQWADSSRPPDALPPAVMDGDGDRCPLSAHIRKINPRDEATDVGHGTRTLRRRIIRRGVTFGPSYRRAPKAERGLLFICYQASIADQFEFLWRVWANKTGTPRADAGFDPIIGQNGNDPPAAREVHFVEGNRSATVTMPERFVISTGGAYLFAPSISAIRDVLAV